MTRYLDTTPSTQPPKPDMGTHIRTNPRVRAVLWTAGISIALLVGIAAIASHLI